MFGHSFDVQFGECSIARVNIDCIIPSFGGQGPLKIFFVGGGNFSIFSCGFHLLSPLKKGRGLTRRQLFEQFIVAQAAFNFALFPISGFYDQFV